MAHFATLFKNLSLVGVVLHEESSSFSNYHHGIRYFGKKVIGTANVNCSSQAFTFFLGLSAPKDTVQDAQ